MSLRKILRWHPGRDINILRAFDIDLLLSRQKQSYSLFHSHAQTFHILRRLIFTTFSSALSDITNHNILDKSGLIVTQFRGFTVTLWESQKYPNTEFFLVRIFPYSVWIRKDTPCLSVFSPHAGKYGPEKTPYLDNFHAVSPFPQDFFWMNLHERFQNGSFRKIFCWENI